MNGVAARLKFAGTALLLIVLLGSCANHRLIAPSGDCADVSFVHYAARVVDEKYYAPKRLDYPAMYNNALKGMADYLKKNGVAYSPGTISRSASESDCQEFFDIEFEKAKALNALEVFNNSNEPAFAAAAGLLDSLKSSHTHFMNPEDYRQYLNDLSTVPGYAGIGVKIGKAGNDCYYFSQVYAGSPADRAGVKEFDELVAVDGVPMSAIANSPSKYIRGATGTKIELDILRRGIPIKIAVMREEIMAPNLESRFVEASGRRLCYIRFYRFHQIASAKLFEALRVLRCGEEGAVEGIILDLRSNPGGYSSVVDEVLNALLPKGRVTFVEVRRNGEVVHGIDGNAGTYEDIPLVVLVNEGSCSASEVCVSALQIHMRAKIVGVKTGGKVETALAFPLGCGAGIKVAIAKCLDANRMDLENTGVMPDVLVEITKDDIASGRDSQLEAGIAELLSEIR